MISNLPLLSIIIVNYKSTSLILDLLTSAAKYMEIGQFQWIVVDNASDDDAGAAIQQQFPFVQFHDMGYNGGFARANNAGIRMAKGDAVLLLNPDTLCVDDSILRCYQRLGETEFSAAGVQLLDVHQQPQISGSYFVKGGLNHLLPIPYWGSLVRWAGYRARTRVPGVQQAQSVQEVDWISGAFLMVKKEAIENAGLLDEDFFLYGEEVEWCSRLGKTGKLAIFGDQKIIHLEGATINKSQNIQEQGYYNLYDRKGLQLMVSNHLRVKKQYGNAWFLFLLLNYTWGVICFFVCSFFAQLFRLRSPFGEWGRAWRFAKNVGQLWMLAPTIMRNKPHFYKMF